MDRAIEVIGEALELGLPHTRSVGVASARISGDEEFAGIRVALGTDSLPPRRNRRRCEHRGIVVGADVHEAVIGSDVMHAVRGRRADGIAGEVMNIDELRLILRLPLTSSLLEIADEFLLFSCRPR